MNNLFKILLGAGALTIVGAVIVASIFEASGVLLAGGDVVGTIKKGKL